MKFLKQLSLILILFIISACISTQLRQTRQSLDNNDIANAIKSANHDSSALKEIAVYIIKESLNKIEERDYAWQLLSNNIRDEKVFELLASDSHDGVKIAAISLLARDGNNDQIDELKNFFKSPDPWYRYISYWGLNKCRCLEKQQIMDGLNDVSNIVRREVIRNIASNNPNFEGMESVLIDVIRHDPDNIVKRGAAKWLAKNNFNEFLRISTEMWDRGIDTGFKTALIEELGKRLPNRQIELMLTPLLNTQCSLEGLMASRYLYSFPDSSNISLQYLNSTNQCDSQSLKIASILMIPQIMGRYGFEVVEKMYSETADLNLVKLHLIISLLKYDPDEFNNARFKKEQLMETLSQFLKQDDSLSIIAAEQILNQTQNSQASELLNKILNNDELQLDAARSLLNINNDNLSLDLFITGLKTNNSRTRLTTAAALLKYLE